MKVTLTWSSPAPLNTALVSFTGLCSYKIPLGNMLFLQVHVVSSGTRFFRYMFLQVHISSGTRFFKYTVSSSTLFLQVHCFFKYMLFLQVHVVSSSTRRFFKYTSFLQVHVKLKIIDPPFLYTFFTKLDYSYKSYCNLIG